MRTDEIVQRAIDYVEDHLAESLSLEEIAGVAAMSVPNLYRLFHSMTGHPIKEYVRKRRISEAAACLRETSLPVIDIGFRFGFDSYPAFMKTFKRLTGLTPGLYRESQWVYSFERMNLKAQLIYPEEREISERFPEVRVIRVDPQKGIGYLHASEQENGIEMAAIDHFRTLLASHRIDISELKLFGWNVDRDSETKPFGYQLLAVDPRNEGRLLENPPFASVELQGGLYAVTRTPEVTEDFITATWNRLFAEWLPRSVFDMERPCFIEEYVLNTEQIVRMKLYLPVKRSNKVENIEIVEMPSVQVISFRAYGLDRVRRADEASIAWLSRHGFTGECLPVFMRCDYGMLPENANYEVMIAPSREYHPSQDDLHLQGKLEGGIYACLESGIYGTMTGVLDRIYGWLDTSSGYKPDTERPWFVSYMTNECKDRAPGQEIKAKCYVPVKREQ